MTGPATRALHDRLLGNLASSPERAVTRLHPGNRSLDPDTFERMILGAERRLARVGGHGERSAVLEGPNRLVLLSARNCEAYLVAIAALWKRGRVPLLADANLTREEIGELVTSFRPSFCLLDRRVDPEGAESESLGEMLPGLRACLPKIRAGTKPLSLPDDAAAVRLTSGTAVKPRGVVVSVEQLLADARQIARTMKIEPGDTMVTAIPLGHAYGFVHAMMSLVHQGTRLVLLEQPLPALLVEALTAPGPLVLPGTPYLFELLTQAAGRHRFKGLRLCLSAGAPLPEALSRAFKERFGLPIRTFYGASECGGIGFDRSRDGVVPDGCAGTPLDGVELSVQPEAGYGDGIGRIRVRSAAVASGYVPAAAGDLHPGAAGRPGTFLTSDLGRLDDKGRILLAGRVDRLINVGGRKVNPAEVEALLKKVPGVSDAVVFGVADRHRGQTVCACVVGARAVTREAVLEACRANLAPFKIPRRIEFTSRLPVTERGKTDRSALARLISARPEARP
jgi:acyl-coenzyme A synthetase/AMP-(fatty) acid ligase